MKKRSSPKLRSPGKPLSLKTQPYFSPSHKTTSKKSSENKSKNPMLISYTFKTPMVTHAKV